jgi:hypothetical protein
MSPFPDSQENDLSSLRENGIGANQEALASLFGLNEQQIPPQRPVSRTG